jgi:transcriptional regulator with XRE-family HTH domain
MPSFADNLRRLRHDHFWSQAELARRTGLSKLTITQLEAGERAPYGQTVRRLAEALGVSPHDLALPEELAEQKKAAA